MRSDDSPPLIPPTEVGGKEAIGEFIWSVIRELLAGRIVAAEIRLREHLAAEEFRLSHARSKQIGRVEEIFEKVARVKPWPRDFRPADLIHWRGKLGSILNELPLARIAEDLKVNATGKQNLLYFLSSERGKRASRWEMLLCEYREQEWEKGKQREREDAERALPDDLLVKKAEPEFVKRLQREQQAIDTVLAGEPSGLRRQEYEMRRAQIEGILKHWGWGEKQGMRDEG